MAEGVRRWHSAVERMVDEPWRGRIKAFLQDHHAAAHLLRREGKVIVSGLVALATDAALEVDPYEFNPGRGYVVPTKGLPRVRLMVPELGNRATTPAIGDHVTCIGTQLADDQWEALTLGMDTVIVFRPKFVASEPLHIVRLFAGAYGGWTRAAHWLSTVLPDLQVGHELFVDNDERIMEVWSTQHGIPHRCGRTPGSITVDLTLKAGVCTGVDDTTIPLTTVEVLNLRLVRQAWDARLTSHNALVQVFERWLTIAKVLSDIPIVDALAITSQISCSVWTSPLLLIRPAGHSVIVVPKQISRSTPIVTNEGDFQIANHNNQPCTMGDIHLANGDWLLIEPIPKPVAAGGHHRWTTNPETLARGASFTSRISFCINTHGWAASDEIHAAMMWLLARFPETIAEFNVLCWRSSEHEFNDELYGEPRFADNGRTVTALLVDNHWAAIEINRIGTHTQIHVFGLGAGLAQRALLIMCRCIDVAPHRVQQHIHSAMPPEHLCGWFLLQRYYTLCRALHQLPEYFDLFNDLPPFRRAEIREAWESSQEEWRRAGASDNLILFATTLRTHFLVRLAATATETSSVVNVPLHVEFPAQAPPTARPPSATHDAVDPHRTTTATLANSTAVDVQHCPVEQPDRIRSRLLECFHRPGWLSSDTLDHALDFLRWHHFHICFCPPALWHSDTQSLHFFAGLDSLHDTFGHLFLFVLWNDHWILLEVHVHEWEASIQTVGPVEILPALRRIVTAACQLLRLHNIVINSAATHFDTAVGLCGWSLLRTLFRRFQVTFPPLGQPWLAALRVHRHHNLIRQVQVTEARAWEANGDHDLLQFASAAVLDFLIRIVQNRFPDERATGGALTDATGSPLSVLQFGSEEPSSPQQRVLARLALFDLHPGRLFSDTADYILDFLREADPDTVYLPPTQWNSDGVTSFNDLCAPLSVAQKCIGLLLWDHHWILCEFQSTVCAQWLFLTGPPELRPVAVQCANALCQHLAIAPTPHVVCRDFSADPHLCGWTLLWLCFEKVGIQVHYPGPLQEASFLRSVHHVDIQRVLTNAATAWQQPTMHQAAFFAMRLLPWHILQVLQGRFPAHQAAGGAGEAKAAAKPKNSQQTGTDPLMKHDPWAKAAAASSRWEDLKLEDKHPFQDSKGEQLIQFHRLQTTPSTKGVVLVSVYGFRRNKHTTSTREDDQLQVIAKLPSAARQPLLTVSGHQGILLRDFLDAGSQPIDTSVIPKFWEVSVRGLRELNIGIDGVKGVAGAILTRRGLAIRAWTTHIAEVRRNMLPNDSRLNDTNMGVVPRFMMDASGWPPGACPGDVIESVTKAVSQPPIPTRTFRSAGVHTWQLGFQSLPDIQTFTVKINGALHQILLTPTPHNVKGGGKGKQRQPKKASAKEDNHGAPTATIATATAHQDKKRIDQLETRFESLQKQVSGIENKQTTLESKLDQRFNDIGDTLRQLVQLSTTRTHEPCGESPPPKTQRTL
ncbi:unnamed protein product [Durusdinium trenchii]|uniref:Uncharacterized protein n=1 Tax=Durusdinium trenchii TaxID=1381693 RepID=A0ABP0MJL5_9DINO